MVELAQVSLLDLAVYVVAVGMIRGFEVVSISIWVDVVAIANLK